jgi:hypothetical protein
MPLSPPQIQPTMPLPHLQAPAAGSTARSSGALIAGIIAGVILLGVCAVAVGVAASRAGSLGGSPAPTESSQHQLAQRYDAVVKPDLQSLRSSVDDVRSRCAGSDAIGCRTALRNMQTQAQGFLRDLDGVRVPDCHRETDKELRMGLDLYKRGTASAIQGIDTSNTVVYAQGGSQLDEGSTHMNRASTLFNQATCP